MLTYEEYLIESARLTKLVDIASAKLQTYPSGDMGLTPEHIRKSPEFIADKQRFNMVMRQSQQFNKKYVKTYGKRRAAEKRALRTKKV